MAGLNVTTINLVTPQRDHLHNGGATPHPHLCPPPAPCPRAGGAEAEEMTPEQAAAAFHAAFQLEPSDSPEA